MLLRLIRRRSSWLMVNVLLGFRIIIIFYRYNRRAGLTKQRRNGQPTLEASSIACTKSSHRPRRCHGALKIKLHPLLKFSLTQQRGSCE